MLVKRFNHPPEVDSLRDEEKRVREANERHILQREAEEKQAREAEAQCRAAEARRKEDAQRAKDEAKEWNPYKKEAESLMNWIQRGKATNKQ